MKEKLRHLTHAASWLLTALSLATVGALILFTRFLPYDDEGYVLWSVRQYCTGHPLYDAVYSQYGPLFYAGYQGLCKLTGLILDSDSGRGLTLGYWVGASFLAGRCVRLLTGRSLLGLAGFVLCFIVLSSNAMEPFHPGSMLALLVALAAWLGIKQILAEHEYRLPGLVALCASAACFIKINVGAFLFIALAGWLLINGRDRWRPSRRGLAWAMAGLALLPILLMARSLDRTSIAAFAICTSGLVFGLGWRLIQNREDLHGGVSWGTMIAVPLVLGALLVALLWHQGTSLSGIVEGVLLGPLRHPDVYIFPPAFPWAAIALLIPALALDRILPSGARGRDILALLKLAAAGMFAGVCFDPITGMPPDVFPFYYGPALALVIAAPLREAQTTTTSRAIRWLAWIYAWQLLHAYPVAGSQIAWSTFLWVPLCLAGTGEALLYIEERMRWKQLKILYTAELLLSGIALLAAARMGILFLGWWQESTPLGFPSARWVRPEQKQADALRLVRKNLRHHADMVFSLPGMFSFNIWTDKPTPTQANVTHWFSLLNDTKQHAIIDTLAAAPRAMIVVFPGHLTYLENKGFSPRGPLLDYLRRDFQPVTKSGIYELWAHRSRPIPAAVDTFVITSEGLSAATEPLPRPPAKALLRDLSAPTAPGIALQPSAGGNWRSDTPPEQGGLTLHRITLPPISGRTFSNRLELTLLAADGQPLAVCLLDPIQQALNDAAPPKAN